MAYSQARNKQPYLADARPCLSHGRRRLRFLQLHYAFQCDTTWRNCPSGRYSFKGAEQWLMTRAPIFRIRQ
jgi:hypothetical protein